MLLKRADPDRQIVVFERNRPDDTFGFGVVFSDATLAGIHAADPVLLTALTDHGVHWDTIEVRLRGERHRCGGNGMAAVERRTLLHLLQERAATKVSTSASAPTSPSTTCWTRASISSSRPTERTPCCAKPSRTSCRPTFDTATARFIWLGTTYPFEGLTFVHERRPHGVFAAHAYPIGNGVSTFIVETDATAWRRAGLDEFDTAPAGPSDEQSRDYLQTLFADQIDGHRLLVNNSRWAAFRTARRPLDPPCRATGLVLARRRRPHCPLLRRVRHEDGDGGRHRAGGVTRQRPDDIEPALGVYEAIRRPQVAKIQAAARQGLSWWETFGRTYDELPPWQFAYHFFTRSLPESKLRYATRPSWTDPSRWAAEHGADPIDSTFTLAGTSSRNDSSPWTSRRPSHYDVTAPARPSADWRLGNCASRRPSTRRPRQALRTRLRKRRRRREPDRRPRRHATPPSPPHRRSTTRPRHAGAAHRGRHRRRGHDRHPLRSHRPRRPAVIATSPRRRRRQRRLTWTTRSSHAMPADRTTLHRGAGTDRESSDRTAMPAREDMFEGREPFDDPRSRRRVTDRDRRLCDESVDAIANAGLWRIFTPVSAAGGEAGLSAQVDAVIELSAAHPAAGWVLMVTNAHSFMIGNFPVACQDEVFGDDPDARGSREPSSPRARRDGPRVAGACPDAGSSPAGSITATGSPSASPVTSPPHPSSGGSTWWFPRPTSNSRVTFSLTSTPPASSAAFQLTPQSLRLTVVLPSRPMRGCRRGRRRRRCTRTRW